MFKQNDGGFLLGRHDFITYCENLITEKLKREFQFI